MLRLFPACTQLVLDLPEVMRGHNVILPKKDEVITGFVHRGVRLNEYIRLGALSTAEASPILVRTEPEPRPAPLTYECGKWQKQCGLLAAPVGYATTTPTAEVAHDAGCDSANAAGIGSPVPANR